MCVYKSDWDQYQQIILGCPNEDVLFAFTILWRQNDKYVCLFRKQSLTQFHANCLFWNEFVSGKWRPGRNCADLQCDMGFCHVCDQGLFCMLWSMNFNALSFQQTTYWHIFFSFFPENRNWYIMQIVFIEDLTFHANCLKRRQFAWNVKSCITKTYLYDPLKPHFYIVKLGFTGVYIIFSYFCSKHRLWYSLEPPRPGGSNEYPQSMFWAEIYKKKKKKKNFIRKLSVFGGEILNIFE